MKTNMTQTQIMDEMMELGETGELRLKGADLYARREENCDWLFVGTVEDPQAAAEMIEHFND